jgi:hypothetical protein
MWLCGSSAETTEVPHHEPLIPVTACITTERDFDGVHGPEGQKMRMPIASVDRNRCSSQARFSWRGVRFAKESDFDQQKFGRVDQGKAAFPLRKTNIGATGLLQLSGASLISVV